LDWTGSRSRSNGLSGRTTVRCDVVLLSSTSIPSFRSSQPSQSARKCHHPSTKHFPTVRMTVRCGTACSHSPVDRGRDKCFFSLDWTGVTICRDRRRYAATSFCSPARASLFPKFAKPTVSKKRSQFLDETFSYRPQDGFQTLCCPLWSPPN
jgi:hypothetical protein